MTESEHTGQKTIKEQLDALNEVQRQIKKARLPRNRSPAERLEKSNQLQARAEFDGARAGMALSGTLTAIAEEIGFSACPLDRNALRGAFLEVLDNARNPDAVARFYARDAEYQSNKRRPLAGSRVFVPFAAPPPGLREAASELKLRFNGLAGGFEGRGELDELITLGQRFNCTVRTQVDGEMVELVSKGKIDEEMVRRLRSRSVSLPSAVSAGTAVQQEVSGEDQEPEADLAAAAPEADAETAEASADREGSPRREVAARSSPNPPHAGINRIGLRPVGGGAASTRR